MFPDKAESTEQEADDEVQSEPHTFVGLVDLEEGTNTIGIDCSIIARGMGVTL